MIENRDHLHWYTGIIEITKFFSIQKFTGASCSNKNYERHEQVKYFIARMQESLIKRQSKRPSIDNWMKKKWYILLYTMEYYLTT